MNGTQNKKFRRAVRKLWKEKFTETINNMKFMQRLNLAWKIILKDF